MKVLKFGGSSVAKPERIERIVKILKGYFTAGEKFTVVFSAFGGVTDSLIAMSNAAAAGNEKEYLVLFEAFRKRHIDAIKKLIHKKNHKALIQELNENHQSLKNLLNGIFLVREASLRTMDYVLSFGERNSAFIISHVLQQNGIKAEYLDARDIIKTDKNFGSAKVNFDLTYPKIKAHYTKSKKIQIVTGFISSATGGLTTTLGRGGSDYTASLLAAGLNAKLIEIWTDVDGVLTADPRKVKKAFTIPTLTFAEAMEMSHFGAKVIYPPTLQPALKKNISLVIKNTFNPEHPGTFISSEGDSSTQIIKGISSIADISLLTLQGSGMFGVPGTAGRLFGVLANAGINIVLITQGSSEHSISFAIKPTEAKKAKRLIDKAFEYEIRGGIIDPIVIEKDLSVVAIIGENMRLQPGIAGRLFQALGKNGINCIAIAQGSSELNVSVVIRKSDEAKSLNVLHESFFLSDTRVLNLFMVGVGLIGSTLLEQIKKQAAYLKKEQSIEIKILGISNSKKMLFSEDGINLKTWKKNLLASTTKASLPKFVDKMKTMNLSNTIFIDNTASEDVSDFYESILASSISISTPNKIATSSSYLQYQQLKNLAKKNGVLFLYETNVGAGLPVISTMKDLINSGDRILKIEGVLSGSLSYIFNSFKEGIKFSDVVKEAKDLGYTEPDPRIDLNGIDVRRKLIILARETGLKLDADDVKIENILPVACQKAKSVAAFFKAVEKADDTFEKLRASAAKKNKVLRMIAQLHKGKASIKLQAVDSAHPFYSLNGSDNMIVFTTERYKERPLVIRGPGAGAEVTAAGIFAEVITIGNFLN